MEREVAMQEAKKREETIRVGQSVTRKINLK
jgi:hypothetical protein